MSQWQIYGQRKREIETRSKGDGKQKQMFIISNSVSINSIVLQTGPKNAPTGEGGASINFYDAPANVAAAAKI